MTLQAVTRCAHRGHYEVDAAKQTPLNADKTELVWYATPRRLHLLPVTSITVGSEMISPSSSVRDLGVIH